MGDDAVVLCEVRPGTPDVIIRAVRLMLPAPETWKFYLTRDQ